MHMVDALVSPVVGGTMYVASSAVATYSIKKISNDENKKLPIMGVMGAFIFAAQMINFSIPGTGSSGHLCGSMLLSAVLGPCEAFITMIGILLVQCLLFADGGILALGCNIWNMAFYGCFVGGMIIWKMLMRRGITKRRIVIGSILGAVISMQMGAFSVVLETKASGVSEIPFIPFVVTMQPIHLAIGIIEGVITASILVFIYEARPNLLWTGYQKENEKKSMRGVVAVIAIISFLIAAVLSNFASGNPDGLEWSLEKLNQVEMQNPSVLAKLLDSFQKKTAILPDYSLKNGNEILGTSISGVFGAVVVVVIFIIVSKLIMFMKRKKVSVHEQE